MNFPIWKSRCLFASFFCAGAALCVNAFFWNIGVGIGSLLIFLFTCSAAFHFWKTAGNWRGTVFITIGAAAACAITCFGVMLPVYFVDYKHPAFGTFPSIPQFFVCFALPLSIVAWVLWQRLAMPRMAFLASEPNWWQFSLWTIFAVMTLVSIDLAVILRDLIAGVWMGWALVAGYAWFVRANVAAKLRNVHPWQIAKVMLVSFFVGLSAAIACGVTCSAVVIPVGIATYSPNGNSSLLFPILMSVGAVAGCFAAALVLRLAWPRQTAVRSPLGENHLN